MKKQLLKILVNILALYIGVSIFHEIQWDGGNTLVTAGILLWFVNLFIRPLLLLISLPINFITLGLFSVVINTWMILLTDSLLSSIKIPNFYTALIVSLIVSFGNILLKGIDTPR